MSQYYSNQPLSPYNQQQQLQQQVYMIHPYPNMVNNFQNNSLQQPLGPVTQMHVTSANRMNKNTEINISQQQQQQQLYQAQQQQQFYRHTGSEMQNHSNSNIPQDNVAINNYSYANQLAQQQLQMNGLTQQVHQGIIQPQSNQYIGHRQSSQHIQTQLPPQQTTPVQGVCANNFENVGVLKMVTIPPSNDKIYIVKNYILGEGSFATTYVATMQGDSKIYACKIIQKQQLIEKLMQAQNPQEKQEFFMKALFNEVQVWKKLEHENIVRFYDYSETTNNYYFIMEYCEGGDLETLKKRLHIVEEKNAVILFHQLIDGCNYLYDKNVFHRDLKPANVLICQGVAKIADFGFCKLVEQNKEKAMFQTTVGTPYYMSPQILRSGEYSIKCDVWSLGIMFYEILTGSLPWLVPTKSSTNELLEKIMKDPLEFPKSLKLTPQIKALITSMLQINEDERISMPDALIAIKQILKIHYPHAQLNTQLQQSHSLQSKSQQLQQNQYQIQPILSTPPLKINANNSNQQFNLNGQQYNGPMYSQNNQQSPLCQPNGNQFGQYSPSADIVNNINNKEPQLLNYNMNSISSNMSENSLNNQSLMSININNPISYNYDQLEGNNNHYFTIQQQQQQQHQQQQLGYYNQQLPQNEYRLQYREDGTIQQNQMAQFRVEPKADFIQQEINDSNLNEIKFQENQRAFFIDQTPTNIIINHQLYQQ